LINYHYVTDVEEARAILAEACKKDLLVVDYETYADTDRHGKIASALDPYTLLARLLQINWLDNAEPFILDLQVVGEKTKEQRIELWTNSAIKVAFNAKFEALVTRADLGIWPQNLMCARILMQLVGAANGFKAGRSRGYSYGALARDLWGVNLDKSLGASDWRGTLTEEQLVYAALDVGAPIGHEVKDSLLLRAYLLLLEQVENVYNMSEVHKIDQEAMLEIARMEWCGLPVNSYMMNEFLRVAREELERYKLILAKHFNFTPLRDVNWDTLEETFIIPPEITSIFNNPTKLVTRLQEHLSTPLEDLQKKTLEKMLKSLESDEEDLDENDKVLINKLKQGAVIIRDLLQYKELAKMVSTNWNALINPVTGRIHAGYSTIGTATGRMSSSGIINGNRFNAQQISNVELTVPVSEGVISAKE
jgi:3'-5' exonuclease